MLTETNLLALCDFERVVLMNLDGGFLKNKCTKVLQCTCPLDGEADQTAPFSYPYSEEGTLLAKTFSPMCQQADNQCANVVGSGNGDGPASVTLPTTPLTHNLTIFENDI